MKRSFFLTVVLFGLSCWQIRAQDSLAFPASWQGIWVGELQIFNARGVVQTVPMELHIQAIEESENYTWHLIYGEDKEAGLRPYELVTIDAGRGLYQIDEKNSIAMEGYLLGGKFFQYFTVAGNALLTSTEKTGPDELVWEIAVSSETPVSVTGNTTEGEEEIPEVKTFPINGLQRAVLTRKK
ncbi:MAG: hypothetical protein KDC43_13375 [Saprospiraceae bacterium]|nr:hypothetical protein [Saprospiraceae bacterium]MCB0624868.1 hypothetical protein [Saprospiraceae bacterium]MCB0678972.1 hypothetical protein [Saprospiraceae bacterium]MCB0680812.1 hypothetical protein [Saprospiraceae bacterium]